MQTKELAETKSKQLSRTTNDSTRDNRLGTASWVLYHFGNAGYTAVVVAAIFNVYFVETVAGKSGINHGTATLLWTLAVGLSNLLVVITAPLLGTICDYSAAKRPALIAVTIGCIMLTALLYFVGPGAYAIGFVLITLSYFLFSTGENLLGAFLPEITSANTMGRVSGTACMVSHLGGLCMLGLCFGYVTFAQRIGQTSVQYVPLTILLVAVNYALFSLPMLFWLKEKAVKRDLPPGTGYWRLGVNRIRHTLSQAMIFQDLFRVLATILSYVCGTSTIVVLASVYARQVMGFTIGDTITMFIVMNLTATFGAYLFGWIQDKIGSKPTLTINLLVWLGSTLVLSFSTSVVAFWIAANLIGIANGGSFTVGRAMVGQLSPTNRAGEFFGLWGLACKAAAIIGPISYGLISYATAGNHRLAILCTVVFFTLALLLLSTVNEKRGRNAVLSAD